MPATREGARRRGWLGTRGRASARVLGWLAAASLGSGLGLVASCDRPSPGQTQSGAPAEAVDGGSTEAADPAVPSEADPKALEELLLAVPTTRAAHTSPDGGSLVGSDTGVPADGGVILDSEQIAPPPRPTPRLRAGNIEVQPNLSTPAIERAARAQFYWPLVQKCRAPDGEILPADAITLAFTIRTDGTVDPASVSATAVEPRFNAAAECMVREFSALPFRAPAAAQDGTPRVVATLPSVD